MYLTQALSDAAAHQPLNTTAMNKLKATLAYEWTTATNPYPTQPTGDAVMMSKQMFAKYSPYFATCSP
jgi:hypothetical protein